MNFVLIFGPPAVGKTTVGQELAHLTGYRLLFNTMTAEPLLEIFPRETHEFGTLNSEFQTRIVEEAAKAGLNLINTAVWAFDSATDAAVMRARQEVATRHGATVHLVELCAPLDIRLERNRHETRWRQKPRQQETLTDEVLADLDRRYRMNSQGEFARHPHYIRIENSKTPAEDVAWRICQSFGFPVVS
ncbi:MAG TPA: AAA family ATPase [Tepidiformaceae bacterium]